MDKLKQLDQKIEELQKEKQIAELEIEIKKIKKTVIEETIIKRIIKEEPFTWPQQPNYPTYPIWTFGDSTITPC